MLNFYGIRIKPKLCKGVFSYSGGQAEEAVYVLLSVIQEKACYRFVPWPVWVFVNKCVAMIIPAILLLGVFLGAWSQLPSLFISPEQRVLVACFLSPHPHTFFGCWEPESPCIKECRGSDFSSSCCTCSFVSVLRVYFQMSCPQWHTDFKGDFTFSNNYGATVHDKLLELIFYLLSYNKWCDCTGEPTLPVSFNPLRGNSYLLIFLSSYCLVSLSFTFGLCWLITWSSFNLMWHLSDILWYLIKVSFCHP